jgi:hypothetical protein
MKSLTIVLAIVLSHCAFANSEENSPANQFWITNVYIVSPENLDHIEKGSVLIENGRIARVERNQHAKPPAGADVVQGDGQYLIPGLMDSHIHLANVPAMPYERSAPEQEIAAQYFKQLPRSYLYYGYTTLVDLAVFDPQVLDDFRRSPLHPDLYDCGGSLPLANGYPMSFLPPATRFKPFPNFIYDQRQKKQIPAEYKPEDHTPAAAVARVKSSGAVCVKTYFERGFGPDRNLPVMSKDTLTGIRKASTQADLVLMMHANAFEAQKFAVDGNVDVIAHGMWNWGKLSEDPGLPDEIKQILDRIVAKRVGYQPTIQVLYGLIDNFDPEYLKMSAIKKVVPQSMIDWFETPDGKWFGKTLNPDDAPDAVIAKELEQGPLRRVRLVVGYLAGKDANFLFGTDTPSAPTYGNLPGLNGYLEMKQLQKAGMSLAQILKAATINNAREFKMESEIGTIEPGKIANLVLMKQSPLESVDAYDTITTIWVHGKEVARENLAVVAQ